MVLNGMEIKKAININDKYQPFTMQILCGEKAEETRGTHSLDSLIGKPVAIVRTGKGRAEIVGTCIIKGCHEYKTRTAFENAYERHLVKSGSPFDFDHSKSGQKIGYILENVKPIENPIVCESRGIVIRNI